MADSFSETVYLLIPLKGEQPPYSEWFAGELAKEPERSSFTSEGSDIELLTCGEVGAPGLLLLHGMGAHADWWRFIAQALATGHRVAAISWPGMDGSEWRESYTLPQLARDIMNVLEIAGLEKGPSRPILIGHSFGGLPLLQAICDYPDQIGGGIMMTWDRVYFDRGLIDLNPAGRRQKAKNRPVVRMNDELNAALTEAYATRQCEYVVERGAKKVASIKQAFQAASERSGLHVTPYMLRTLARFGPPSMASAWRP